jgi:type IV secretory pathway VirB2 component (pilin)
MGTNMSDDVITGEKNPTTALIIQLCCGWAWIFGCLGYFYIGQWQKGLVMILIGMIGVGMVLWIITIVDVYMQAKHLKKGKAIGQWTFFGQSI